MNATAIKLAILAADQIAHWAAVLIKARKNPTMTPEESKAIVAETQSDAAALGAEWDALDET
jgi:hypothetical protein